MKNLVVLLAVAVLAASCYQESNPNVVQKQTPPPSTLDGVTVPDDVTTWLPGQCMMNTDCAEMTGLGACQEGVCRNGECVAVDLVKGTACTDPGLTLDECKQGRCLIGDDGAMGCAVVPAEDGTVCGTFYPACGGVGKCEEGICIDPCNDLNPCTEDQCNEGGCVYSNGDGSCNDNNPCTKDDHCEEGVCVGETTCECAHDNDCEELEDGDICNGTLVCKVGKCKVDKNTVVECEPTGFEPCQTNECQPDTGTCALITGEDGTECEDAEECTDSTFCVEGECTGIGEIVCEMDCNDGEDEDGDNLVDCDDSDCFGVDPCPEPECGDDNCFGGETCATCPQDCGECPPECGDGEIQAGAGEECDDGNKESGDGCDTACKVEPDPAGEGDIIVTEIMKNPNQVGDAEGEWFEVYNTTDADIDINAWFIEDLGTDSHRIYKTDGVVVASKDYLVLGINGDTETNGGVELDYVYAGYNLGNTADEILLVSGATIVDEVDYTKVDPWIDPAGASLSLSATAFEAVANDDGANWCEAETAYGAGDLGTPGEANPTCPYCGDGTCGNDEDCGTCEEDCACEGGSECVDGVCVGLKADGESCGVGGECASGFCADLVCCDSACDLACQSCATAGSNGICANFDLDTDPDDECGLCKVCSGIGGCTEAANNTDPLGECEEEDACGLDGMCNGAGACGFWGEDTVCAAQQCVGQTLYEAGTCDGEGTCEEGASQSCEPFKCNTAGTKCRTQCAYTAHCADGYYCKAQNCLAQLADGETCSKAEECLSGKCTGTVCVAP